MAVTYKQDRQGSRTVPELERNAGKRFSELLGLINDNRDHVDSVESSLSSEITKQTTTLKRDIESISAEAKDTAGKLAKLEITTDGISSVVKDTSERVGEIEDQKMYRLVIFSSNGNIFKNGNIRTTLFAVVYSWDKNVTDTLDPNQFIWTRVSDDAEGDALWNDAHFGGTKSVEITTDDVKIRATFFCDLIDTTTRKSLLA